MMMKKIAALVMTGVLTLSLAACGGGDKKAFEASKAAYNNIDIAYEITEELGSDIYEAWRLGIYDKKELLNEKKPYAYLAKSLNISEDELIDAAAYIMLGEDWDTATDEEKDEMRKTSKLYLAMSSINDQLFSGCVNLVVISYQLNGKTEEAEAALTEAKRQMKTLSENYSDYEHYPSLKGYFTTSSSFFEFCKNPTGSFEQIKTTINDYKNEARNYMSDLDYIFEE